MSKAKTKTKQQQAKSQERKERLEAIRKCLLALSPGERDQMITQHGLVQSIDGHFMSAKNTCLLYLQANGTMPTIVGGYQQWLRAGRQVSKGAHGFTIWFPIGNHIKLDDDDIVTEATHFGTATVFDVTQTEVKATEGTNNPSAVPTEPVKGEQAGMLGVPGKVVVQKRSWTPGQMDIESYGKYQEAMREKDEMQAELEVTQEWLQGNKEIAALTELIPTAKQAEGELTYITKGQYQKHWGKEPGTSVLTEDGKRVRWEYALDTKAQELGLEEKHGSKADEVLRDTITMAKEYKAKVKNLQYKLA